MPETVSTALFVPATLLLAAALAWGADAMMHTPEEVNLRSENAALRRQLASVEQRMERVSGRVDRLAETDRDLFRTLLHAAPIAPDVRRVGVGGSDPHVDAAGFSEPTASLMQRTESELDRLEREVRLQNESYRELVRLAAARRERLAQTPALLPSDGPVVSTFGLRRHPVLDVPKMHEGLDVLVPVGTSVVAAGGGTVRRAAWSPTYGNFIDVEHPEVGLTTRYAHLSEIMPYVRPGVDVRRGQQIGLSGSTGRSTAPHVHFEVLDAEDRPVDPVRFVAPGMTPEQYEHLRSSARHMFGSLD